MKKHPLHRFIFPEVKKQIIIDFDKVVYVVVAEQVGHTEYRVGFMGGEEKILYGTREDAEAFLSRWNEFKS